MLQPLLFGDARTSQESVRAKGRREAWVNAEFVRGLTDRFSLPSSDDHPDDADHQHDRHAAIANRSHR